MATKEGWKQEYQRNYPFYESFAARIGVLLPELLEDANLPLAHIEHRAKRVDRFLDKIDRKGFSDPFNEIKDIVGARIIVYYNDDVLKVADLIRAEFEVDPDHSHDKVEELGVDEFGYRSFHLVCSLRSPRRDLIEWKSFSDLAFEIQVRSVLQHAWAAISHRIDYTTTTQAPNEIRRKLFRLSALLELADDEFAAIRELTARLTQTYREEVDRGDLAIPINMDSLGQYLNEKVDLQYWKDLGIAAGLQLPGGSDHTLNLGNLVSTLLTLGITQLKQFDELLLKHKNRAPEYLARLVAALEKHGTVMFAVPLDVLNAFIAIAEKERFPKTKTWGFWHAGLQETMNDLLDVDMSLLFPEEGGWGETPDP